MASAVVNGAHNDGQNQVYSMLGVIGTLGTADVGGTAYTLPVGIDPSTGAIYVNDLSGGAGTTTVKMTIGTINAGTIDLLKAGTITALANGTIGAGTLNTLGTLSNLLAGSIAVVAGTGVITSGSITVIAGTGVVTSGSIVVTAGTVSNTMVAGTITAGTINVGTIRVDARPLQNILSYGTTFGGTAAGYGTMVGSAGVGTSIWVNDLSIINSKGGTITALVGFGTALNGTSVLAKGDFGAQGGIQKSFPKVVNCGMTNNDLVCYVGAAGTIDVNVSYFISA